MKQRWYQFLCLLLLVAVASTPLALAANGKIVGIVRDASTKDVIPGANVLVLGTTLGGAADAQGRYYILNVPPGTYSLQASAVGYGKLKIEGVEVLLDQTKEINVNLQSQEVQIGEMVITAERRVVDKNRTSTKTTVTTEELQVLPTMTVKDLLNSSPAAFNGYVRGGRITETRTLVDGVDITNQFYENESEESTQGILQSTGHLTRHNVGEMSTTTDMNFDAVEQFSLTTGAAGADVQSATAGTINYSLKDGMGPLAGSVQARLSQFNGLGHGGPDPYNLDAVYFADENTTNARLATERATRATDIANNITVPAALIGNITSDSTRSGKYTYYPGKYLNNNHPLLDFSGSVGGNIMDPWRFFLTGKYVDSHGYFPNDRSREADITLKTTYNITNDIKVNAFGIVNDKGILFGWKNSTYNDNSRYFLEGVPQNAGLDYTGSVKLTHVLSPSTFYEVQASQVYHNLIYGFTDGNGDGFCALDEGGDFLTMSDTAQINKYISQSGTNLGKFFRIGDEPVSQTTNQINIGNGLADITRPMFIYLNTKSISRTVRADLTSQVDFHHQIKAGFNFKFNDVSQINRNTMLGADQMDTRSRLIVDNWEFFPTEMSVYASDRMEFGGLVINLGLRGDRWDPRAKDYANPFNPFTPDTIMIDGQLRRANVIVRQANYLDPQYFVSPRIGVSHPISETAALFYSYSRQAMPPPYTRMYDDYYTVFGTSLPNFTMTNEPLTMSSNYELGAQWEFLPGTLGMNFTAYMRDVQNYNPNSAVTVNTPNGATTWFFDAGYADARGVEVSFQAARHKWFDIATLSGRLNYAYTYIKASSWTGGDQTKTNVTSFAPGDSAKYNNTLPYNNFVYYNKVETDVTGSTSSLTGGYDRTHRITYLVTLEFPEDIILSSLGTFQSGFLYPVNYPYDPRVAGREFASAPWNKMVDLKLEKGFRFNNMRFALFVEVKNFFNWTNIIGYDNTVSGATLWEATNSGNGTTLTQPVTGSPVYIPPPAVTGPNPTGFFNRPMGADGSWFYDIPREFFFGIRVDM
ncbi:MAG TPA: carboxypeptidase regulatory-like domain-containing protein [Bacteroidota bacterium]|nr:carboxypeptidase regulatory-like domain-containing protein [Bacteroidota bacterium]